MDFVSDALTTGRALRTFTLIDSYTIESLAIGPNQQRVPADLSGEPFALDAAHHQTLGLVEPMHPFHVDRPAPPDSNAHKRR